MINYPPYWFFDPITTPITLQSHFFVFEGINRDFNDYWNNETNKHWSSKEAHWNKLYEFITEWTNLYHGLINEEYGSDVNKPRIRCIIETLQEYKDFEFDHILQLLDGLGKLANLMYCAERDVLIGNHVLSPKSDYPLESSYISALEQIVWMVATFVQEGSFIDLVTRLGQLQSSNNSRKEVEKTYSRKEVEKTYKNIVNGEYCARTTDRCIGKPCGDYGENGCKIYFRSLNKPKSYLTNRGENDA